MLVVGYRGWNRKAVPADNGSCRMYWILLVVILVGLSVSLFVVGQITAGAILLSFSVLVGFIIAGKLIHDETVKRATRIGEDEDPKGSKIIQVPESYSDPGIP